MKLMIKTKNLFNGQTQRKAFDEALFGADVNTLKRNLKECKASSLPFYTHFKIKHCIVIKMMDARGRNLTAGQFSKLHRYGLNKANSIDVVLLQQIEKAFLNHVFSIIYQPKKQDPTFRELNELRKMNLKK